MEPNQINTFEEFTDFLKVNELTPKQTNEIIRQAFRCFFINDQLTKDEMIERLIIHWAKWKDSKDKPPFIDFKDPFDIDVKE